MAKQYKKLQNKLHPKVVKKEEPQYKPGKDYLLLIMIGITFILTFVGWENFQNYQRAMYFLLTLSLTLTYLYRHANFSEKVKAYINAASLGSIGMAVALFLLNLYYEFFG